MNVTGLALRRPVTMLMIVAALVLIGIISYQRLPVQQLPNISFPFVVVVVRQPGASPDDMLQTVTLPIENAVSGVAGIQQMSGTSSDGLSRVAVQFVVGTDVNVGANDVAAAVNRVQGQLPSGISPPTIIKANPNSFPIMTLTLSGALDQRTLYDLATNQMQPALQQVPGVATVDVQGGLVRQVNVTIQPDALNKYGLSLDQVSKAIAVQNVSVPGGDTTTDNLTRTVRTDAYYQSADDLRGLVVGGSATSPIRLQDVANIEDGTAPVTQVAHLDGQNAVGLVLTAQSGANVVQVDTAVKQALTNLTRTLPRGVKATVLNDQTDYTAQSIRAVQDDLALAVLLPGLVLLLFLHAFRNTLIVMLAIPTSLISTFTVMYFTGSSIDLISLLALSLITGILVDDSIVVLENIHRHIRMGKPIKQAALDGRTEIGLAALAITMTDVVVYLPVAFTTGLLGLIFREFGLTIVTATLFSLFISFTLTPLLASRWLGAHDTSSNGHLRRGLWTRFGDAWERGFDRVSRGYSRLIHGALRVRGIVVLIGVAALALSVSFIPLGWLGTEFTPQEDNSQFSVNVQLPIGTPLDQTQQVIDKLDAQIRALPGVTHTYATAGSRGGFFGGANTNGGQIGVDLVQVGQRPPLTSYLGRMRGLARQFPNANIISNVPNPLRIGGQRGIDIDLQGQDIKVLNQLADQTAKALQGLPGLVEIRNEGAQSLPELAVQVDRSRAADLGISATTVGNAVQAAISGNTASYLRPTGSTNQIPIVVSVAGGKSLTAEQIAELPLSTSDGTLVRLGQVATLTPTTAAAQLNDQNRLLLVTVSGSTSGDVPLGTVATEIDQAMQKLNLPPGYSYNLGGGAQQQRDIFGPLEGAFALAILLVYMLTSALYESLLYPLAVLLSLPLATVGALGALTLTGNTLNLYSFMGLIMLMGLVAKNAILLVDFTNTLRARGVPRNEALAQAGHTRLRPIVMTTCTMVFAMLPLAIKFGAGSEERSPMATVLVGGLLTSTLLTLVFVPTMYSFLDDLSRLPARVRAWRRGGVMAAPAAVALASNGYAENGAALAHADGGPAPAATAPRGADGEEQSEAGTQVRLPTG